jgi:hypothetical protein
MPRPSQSSYEAASFQHEGPSSAFQVIASRAEEEDNDFEPIMSPDREPASMRLTKGQLIFGRLASAVLSLFLAAVLVYTIETDGSPFRCVALPLHIGDCLGSFLFSVLSPMPCVLLLAALASSLLGFPPRSSTTTSPAYPFICGY